MFALERLHGAKEDISFAIFSFSPPVEYVHKLLFANLFPAGGNKEVVEMRGGQLSSAPSSMPTAIGT